MDAKKTLVIAIAAVSGGGKTTVTTVLNKKLHNSKALYFDDYEFNGPEDICEWVERGSDYNEWNLTPLINDLNSLLSNSIESLDYIILDYPFAYKHNKMSKYIDLTIFIDTPLDIAMARRILRDFKEFSFESIRQDLDVYLSRGRLGYLEALNSIKPNSDFVIDGSLPVEAIVSHIYEIINSKGKFENMNYVKYIRDRVGHDAINLTGVNILIINKNSQILLQRRGTFPYKWGLVGGITELGESLEETAIRESKEETGLDIKGLKLLGTTSGEKCYMDLPNGDKAYFITVGYFTKSFSGVLNIDDFETKDLKFFSYEQLPDNIPNSHRMMIDKYYNNFKGGDLNVDGVR